jgi:hypothetical protein
MVYKVTFTKNGFVVGKSFQEAQSSAKAIEIASMYCCNEYDKATANVFEDDDFEESWALKNGY